MDGSIKSIRKYVAVQDYLKLSDFEKKRFLLELITTCFLLVSKELNWSESAILDAREQSIIQNLSFEYIAKPIWNKSRNIKASIEIILHKEKASIYVLMTQKDQMKPKRKHLIDTPFWLISGINQFNKPKWLNDENFGFEFSTGLTISVSINNARGTWSKSSSKMDDYIKYTLLYNKNFCLKERARLANW